MMASVDFVPVGTVVSCGYSEPPNGNYLACDGLAFAKDKYPELFASIGNIYGGDPGKGEFKVPDYRGLFLRGAAPAAAVGAYQDYGTGLPDLAFRGEVAHLPDSTVGSHGETSGGKSRVNGSK